MNTDIIKRLGDLKKFGIVDEKELNPDIDNDVVISKNKIRNVRTLGSPTLTARSQRLYNPEQPSEVKGPNARQTELGTTQAANIDGSWGKPE